MLGNESIAIHVVARLIAIAVMLQAIEILMLRLTLAEGGVWSWSALKSEFDIFPLIFQRFFRAVLRYPNFTYLLWLQVLIAFLMLIAPSGAPAFILLGCATLGCLRFRGTFNGGSDFMTLVVLSATSVALVFDSKASVGKACLWYIALQACTSYFNAGWVKVKARNWRTGSALKGFLDSAIYQGQQPFDQFIRSRKMVFLGSWTVMLFECSFPVSLICPGVCRVYLGISFMFHLANVYVFGLNRFLFAWMATYPALYFCSQR